MNTSTTDPHAVLGVRSTATPDEVRSAYLSLVRQHPPDQDAAKFQQIHGAYKILSDPLAQATALTTRHTPPDLMETVANANSMRPRLRKLALLALGNRESEHRESQTDE